MQVHDTVLDLIGETPIVRINHLDTNLCTLFMKLESQNPGGSIKDRIGLKILLKESEDFRRIFNRHQQLDKRVSEAELGTAPMEDLALNQLKKEKLLAKDRLAYLMDTVAGTPLFIIVAGNREIFAQANSRDPVFTNAEFNQYPLSISPFNIPN